MFDRSTQRTPSGLLEGEINGIEMRLKANWSNIGRITGIPRETQVFNILANQLRLIFNMSIECESNPTTIDNLQSLNIDPVVQEAKALFQPHILTIPASKELSHVVEGHIDANPDTVLLLKSDCAENSIEFINIAKKFFDREKAYLFEKIASLNSSPSPIPG